MTADVTDEMSGHDDRTVVVVLVWAPPPPLPPPPGVRVGVPPSGRCHRWCMGHLDGDGGRILAPGVPGSWQGSSGAGPTREMATKIGHVFTGYFSCWFYTSQKCLI